MDCLIVDEVKILMYDFLVACGVEKPTEKSRDEVIVFDRVGFVEVTLVEPEGKSGAELTEALAKAYERDMQRSR